MNRNTTNQSGVSKSNHRLHEWVYIIKELQVTDHILRCKFFYNANEKDYSENNVFTGKTRKKRQTRVTFTPFQVQELEKVFRQSHYPDINSRDQLASHLHLSEGRIQVGLVQLTNSNKLSAGLGVSFNFNYWQLFALVSMSVILYLFDLKNPHMFYVYPL